MTPCRTISRRAHKVTLGLTGLAVVALIAACGSTSSSSSTTAPSGRPASAGGGSNARSGPAAGGSIGAVGGVSTTGFSLSTPTGGKATIKETASTKYENGTTAASKSAVTNGAAVLVLGIDDNTTITATQIIAAPSKPNAKTASEVVAFNATGDKSKTVGQIPTSYKQGSGTIVSGTTANKAIEAALLTYPGGVVDRVVKLSDGDYEVHNIGVSWPHHVFVNSDFKVVGAGD